MDKVKKFFYEHRKSKLFKTQSFTYTRTVDLQYSFPLNPTLYSDLYHIPRINLKSETLDGTQIYDLGINFKVYQPKIIVNFQTQQDIDTFDSEFRDPTIKKFDHIYLDNHKEDRWDIKNIYDHKPQYKRTLGEQFLSHAITELSNTQQDYDIWFDNNILHLIYTSGGNIFYAKIENYPENTTWTGIEQLTINGKNKQPTIAFYNNDRYIMYIYWDSDKGTLRLIINNESEQDLFDLNKLYWSIALNYYVTPDSFNDITTTYPFLINSDDNLFVFYVFDNKYIYYRSLREQWCITTLIVTPDGNKSYPRAWWDKANKRFILVYCNTENNVSNIYIQQSGKVSTDSNKSLCDIIKLKITDNILVTVKKEF